VILGIDPGPIIQSYVVFDGKRVIASGDVPLAEMVRLIYQDHSEFMIAIEHIDCMGMAVGSETFHTVFNSGRMFSVAAVCRMIPRRDIKIHLCGSNRAKDSNVRQALIDKVGAVGTKRKPGPCYGVSNHLWSALAVAVTATDLDRTPNEFFPPE
jgi:hypothetical protein